MLSRRNGGRGAWVGSFLSCVGLTAALGCDGDAPPEKETAAVQAASAPAPAERLPSLANVPGCTGDTRLIPGIVGSPGHLAPDTKNPNGASELALLMRAMRDDLASARERILAGEPARIPDAHHRIRCAWPTRPVDRNRRFDVLAVGYLRAVDAFNEKSSPARFDAMVGACVRCHEGACTGALAAIRPLWIGDAGR